MRISKSLLAAALSSVALASPAAEEVEEEAEAASSPALEKRNTTVVPPTCADGETSWPLFDTADSFSLAYKYKSDLHSTELKILPNSTLDDVRGSARLCVYNIFNATTVEFTGLSLYTPLDAALTTCCGDPDRTFQW